MNGLLRCIDERSMVAHQHRGNQSCGVAVNPALGTPSSLAGGVKAPSGADPFRRHVRAGRAPPTFRTNGPLSSERVHKKAESAF